MTIHGALFTVHAAQGGFRHSQDIVGEKRHAEPVLCWDGGLGLTLEAIAAAILSRWGASENTFKHI
jgi:hypothetical protein